MKFFIIFILISILIIKCIDNKSTNPEEDFELKVIPAPESVIIQCIDFTANNNLIIGTSDGVFLLGNDGNSWISLNDSLFIKDIYSIKHLPNGDIMAGTEGAGIFIFSNQKQYWEEKNSGLSIDITIYNDSSYSISNGKTISHILQTSIDNIFISTYNFGIYKSINFGETWSLCHSIGSYDMVESPTNRIWSGPKDLYYSDDDGVNWNKIDIFSNIDNHIYNIEVNSQNTIFFGSEHSGIYRLEDNGSQWAKKNSGLPDLSGIFIEDILVDESDNIIISEYYNGLYFSNNNGENWEKIENVNFDLPIKCLAIGKDGFIYSGDRKNIYILNPKKYIN